jgi:protein-tyrosine kinase
MEKIKQALERARTSQTSSDGGADKRSQHEHHKYISGQMPDIVYTETKTVALDKLALREKRVIFDRTSDGISDQYKLLRTQVVQKMKVNGWNALAITSPTEGCGKTLTAINLSISLARDVNHSVLLVDMDLRRPSIHSYFYSQEEPGISDYLEKHQKLNEILFNPNLERLVILPGNKPIENSSEMLSSPAVVQLVTELKNRYPNRIVIFDMPPLLSCDDMLAFAPFIDAVMLVVEEGNTSKEDLKRSYELIGNTNVLGIVLNKSQDAGNSFGYY